jgi:hypothetical protein
MDIQGIYFTRPMTQRSRDALALANSDGSVTDAVSGPPLRGYINYVRLTTGTRNTTSVELISYVARRNH